LSHLEPKNMGAWTYCQNALRTTLANAKRKTDVKYAGRQVSASPACASNERHAAELARFLDEAFAPSV